MYADCVPEKNISNQLDIPAVTLFDRFSNTERMLAACYICIMCVCVSCVFLDGEGSRVFASAALVVTWLTTYLTCYSHRLTSFCEPLSPPHTCHTGLKNV